jgi:hypothetical protein
VFDDKNRTPEGMPGYSNPYSHNQPFVIDDPHDYASTELLQNTITYEWIHPLGEIVTSLLAAGLSLKWLHEHDSVAWRMFEQLVKDSSGMYRWPEQPWFPLALSLRAERHAK